MKQGSAMARSRIMLAFFAIAIILLPFNALPYFKSVFREMANEGAFYPLMLAVLVYVLRWMRGARTYVPTHYSFAILLSFIVWVSVSGVMNSLGILEASTKGRTGVEKFTLQFILLLFVFVSTILIYQLSRQDSVVFLLKFRRFALYSLVPVMAYSIVEIAAISGNADAMSFLLQIDYFIRDEAFGSPTFGRIRSVSGEPSYFAMYISFVFPWVFSYLIDQERRRWPYVTLVACVAALVILTFSRSAYGVLGLQILVLISLICVHSPSTLSQQRIMAAKTVAILVVATASLWAFDFVTLDAVGGVLISLLDTENISNIGRYGSQTAAFSMAMDNPLFGVGFGQYGFKAPEYFPIWSLISPEIAEWMSSSPDSAWAPALGLYARIAGELGFIGLFLWGCLWISVLHSCYRRFKANSMCMCHCDGIGLALLVSVIGILMAGFNSDSLRFFGYWISLGLCWAYLELKVTREKRGNDSVDALSQQT
jgi:hypothetical protein